MIVRLIDFDHPDENNFLVVNQYTLQELDTKRPNIVVFVNGFPLGGIELKSPSRFFPCFGLSLDTSVMKAKNFVFCFAFRSPCTIFANDDHHQEQISAFSGIRRRQHLRHPAVPTQHQIDTTAHQP